MKKDVLNRVLAALGEIVAKVRELEIGQWISAAVILFFGWILARLAASLFRRFFAERLEPQQLMLGGKVIRYTLLTLTVVAALDQAEAADLKVFLGAAGILTVALGFAAQTSASNLISGLFLVGEQPFKVGDLIQVGGHEGFVLSIDLLSVKLRTFDNIVVRIPNETMLKSDIGNLSHFPIRRRDLVIPIAYREDIRRVEEILLRVARSNPHILDEPKPLFFFRSYGDSAIELRFSVWLVQENIWESINRIQQEIKEALDAESIEIPFPHRSLYTGSMTEPLPIRVVREEGSAVDKPATEKEPPAA